MEAIKKKMIICRHKYDSFWFDPNENKVDNVKNTNSLAIEFLIKSLDCMSNLSGVGDKLNGEIYQGYDPKKLDQNVTAFRWLIDALIILKERIPDFDDVPDISIRTDMDGDLLKTFIVENKNFSEILRKESLEVLVDKDVVSFHRISCFVTDSLSDEEILLNKNFSIKNDSEFDKLFTAEFIHYIGSKVDFEKLNLQVREIKFKNLIFHWDMYLPLSDSDLFYYKSNVISEKNDLVMDNGLMQCKDIFLTVSSFLNKICNLLISKSKVHYEAKILKESFEESKYLLNQYEIRIEKIKEALKSTFSPTIPPSDFYAILKFYDDVETQKYQINILVNTCIVNKKYFKYMSQYYLKFNERFDSWAIDCIAFLDKTMDILQTNVMILRDKISHINNNIKVLITMGTHEISLHYASELIGSDQKEIGSPFSPMIDLISKDKSQRFIIYRPRSIRDINYDNLLQHYSEALLLKSKTELEFIIEEVTASDRELVFSSQFLLEELECLEIGKFLNEYKESFDASVSLKILNCNVWDKTKRCKLEKIYRNEAREPENMKDQKWITINSMIAFFESLCTLFDNPKTHVNTVKDKINKKKYLLFITGLLCLKADQCEKAQKFFNDAIVLAHKENKYDWAFSVAQIAGLCESCTDISRGNIKKKLKNEHAETNIKPYEFTDMQTNKDSPFRTKLASNFLDVFDLQKAIDITRYPDESKRWFHIFRIKIRSLLLLVTILTLSSLIVSSYLLYNSVIPNTTVTLNLISIITWSIAIIGAPITLFLGTMRKKAGKLLPEILYPKYLSVITLTVISFSFSGNLILSLSSQGKWVSILVFGIICIFFPAIYLRFKWNTIINDMNRKERRRRILDFLSLSFLEACSLSAVCMFIYGPTFKINNQSSQQYIHDVFQMGIFYFSPIFILLASLVAVLLGIVFKDILNPVGTYSN